MHSFTVRVYYEDTDLAGIVYYANYLKFIERARSELVRELGIDQNTMKAQGLVFAVRHINADYLAPARFDDELTVTTVPKSITAARVILHQKVMRGETELFRADVTLVCVTEAMKPARLPPVFREVIKS